jgi:hypothetical protein
VDMHATDFVGINDITQILLVHTCQQGVYPRGHVLPLRLPLNLMPSLKPRTILHSLLYGMRGGHRQFSCSLYQSTLSIVVLWETAPCSLVSSGKDQRFRDVYSSLY